MKKLLYILSFQLFSVTLFAQNNCANNVSTDAMSPINSSLPVIGSNPNNVDVRYLNYFDWTSNNDIPLNNMNSVYQYPMTPLIFPGSSTYYNYIYEGEKMTPSNGWELMLFNIGRYPNGDNYVPTGMQDIPFVVLYNRFTGILRVFATYGSGLLQNGLSFDGVVVSVYLPNPNKTNGTLRLRNGDYVALDRTTDVTFTQALAFHENHSSRWFSCDFQLTYDPCVCFYPSNLKIKFDFLQSLNLTLYGRSISVEDDLANGNNLLTNNFLTNFQFDGTLSEDQIVLYKVMDDFVSDYISRLTAYKNELEAVQEYNKDIERKLAIANMFKKVIIDGGSAAISSLTGTDLFTSIINYGLDLVHEDGASEDEVKKVIKNITDQAKKAFGKEVESFIKKNFEKKKEPNKPGSPPMAAFTEMYMQGTISDKTPVSGPEFYTPGTYSSQGTGNPQIQQMWQYPIYNNATGVFALLNSPKVKLSYNNNLINTWESIDYIDPNNTGPLLKHDKYVSWDRSFQLQLKEPLYYVFNPSAKIKSYDVRLAFEITDKIESQPLGNSITTNCFIDPTKTVNLSSFDVNTDEFYPIKVNDGKGFNYGKNYCNVDPSICTFEENNIWMQNVNKDSIKLSSDFFPADAFQNIVLGASIMNQSYFSSIGTSNPLNVNMNNHGYHFDVKEVKLKMLIDVVHDQLDENGQNVTSTHVYTYTIDGSNIEVSNGEIVSNLANSNYNLMQYAENLSFNTVEFNGSQIQGCQLNGNIYTCQAREVISIMGDLTTSNGYSVFLKAGNEIISYPESSVSPQITLEINPIYNYSNPMPVVDQTFLSAYCRNQLGNNFPNYQANTASRIGIEEYEIFRPTDSSVDTTNQPIEMNVYPVPSNSFVNVVFSMPIANPVFTVKDLMGKEITISTSEINNRYFEVNFNNVSNGIYFLEVNSLDGTFKKQIILLNN